MQEGLEAQLLGIVVRKEKPELEEQKDSLVIGIANGKKKLKELEDELLRLLNETQGSLLEDEGLFLTLQTSKVTSAVGPLWCWSWSNSSSSQKFFMNYRATSTLMCVAGSWYYQIIAKDRPLSACLILHYSVATLLQIIIKQPKRKAALSSSGTHANYRLCLTQVLKV